MDIEVIDNKAFPILFRFGKNTYHFWTYRTITIAHAATYQLAEKQGQAGWYTKDGWLSYRKLKKELNESSGR